MKRQKIDYSFGSRNNPLGFRHLFALVFAIFTIAYIQGQGVKACNGNPSCIQAVLK